LAVTNHISQNVAPIPLLWVLPLAVYLITFIVTFESDRWYTHRAGLVLHGLALAGMGYLLVIQTPETNIRLVVPALLAGLFCCCLFCHGELARRKPGTAHLTQFYLMIALGGALGALMVGVVAPAVLVGPYDLAMAVAACGLFTLLLVYRKWWVTDLAWTAIAVGVFVAAGLQVRNYKAPARVMMRNFYGGLRVVDAAGSRTMVHGVVSHGMQYLDPKKRRVATMYYAPGTGVERAIEATRHAGQRVGVIGLGAGTLAAYSHAGDVYRFYEINPQVVDLARREFTFLSDSSGSVSTVTADGRLALEREAPQNFDVLAVDAFSGDSVPVHLLSREAMQLYLRHVRPGGLLAFHVSNSALSLADVVKRLAEDQGYAALRVVTSADQAVARSASDWVLVARESGAFEQRAFHGLGAPFRMAAGLRTWTDDYSTLFPILK
jgi:SAM-dependent methyltransferase